MAYYRFDRMQMGHDFGSYWICGWYFSTKSSEEAVGENDPSKNKQPNTAQKPRKILILEDERLVAENLKIMVEESSYQVVAMAGSGREAVQLASTTDPDLLLMDISVHGDLDGIETAILIQRTAKRNVPIVFLTAFSREQFPHLLKLDSSSFVYLTKPYTKEHLLRAIDQALASAVS